MSSMSALARDTVDEATDAARDAGKAASAIGFLLGACRRRQPQP
jgi:hypothetical protein